MGLKINFSCQFSILLSAFDQTIKFRNSRLFT